MPAPPVLALRDVRLRYGAGFALDVPALDVPAGEVLALVGPNGSGKSTLLRVLSLLQAPDAGEVRFEGAPVTVGDGLPARRRMATVFQQPLLADATVADNVALGLRFRGVAAGGRIAPVARWLQRFGIADLAGRHARTLSGGQAQRVALARALVLDPVVLLLDEPFTALDPPTRAELVPELGAILRADQVTTVVVTHERGEAQALADRVGVMLGGRLRQLDHTAVVFQAPADEEVARFVGIETIVDGRIAGADEALVRIEVGRQVLEVAAPGRIGERVRVCIRPEDVTLVAGAASEPRSSARNALSGTVARITPSPAYVRVVVDCGFPLVAALTRRSVDDLALAEGTPITAMFKASAAHIIRVAG